MIPVTFCLPGVETDAELREIEEVIPDRDWRFFGGITGLIWIGQTYLRLRNAGYPVRLASQPPQTGVVVVEGSSRKSLFRQAVPDRALVVSVRADHRPQLYADVEIVQNDRFADDARTFFVQHWPQPGLVPRDAARAERVESVAFKGHETNLHSDFRGPEWREFLQSENVAWLHDRVAWHGGLSQYDGCDWNDYTNVDLVLAVRHSWSDPCVTKPASKLVNAWHAGVPAILGPEYTFTSMRRSPLDYLEVRSLAEAQAAVRQLKGDPQLYRAMVENGHERAREVTVEAVTQRWAELLFEVLPERAEARSSSRLTYLDRRYKCFLDRAQRFWYARQKRSRHPWRQKVKENSSG